MILPDANMDASVTQAVHSAFEHQGQKCSALSCLHVILSMGEGTFQAKLAAPVNSSSLGPMEEFEHIMGLVIVHHPFDNNASLVEAAAKEGGQVVAGGEADD